MKKLCNYCYQGFKDGEVIYIVKSATYYEKEDDYFPEGRDFQLFHPECLTESGLD